MKNSNFEHPRTQTEFEILDQDIKKKIKIEWLKKQILKLKEKDTLLLL